MTPNQYYNQLALDKQKAEKFQKSGGDICLFWAGQIAVAAKNIVGCSVLEIGDNLNWLDLVVNEYDSVMIERANKKFPMIKA